MRTHPLADDDDGFTLVEVIVAMVVFAIVLTGFLYTVTASLAATRDTRTRIVAANLASQQIDLVRSASTVFDVVNSTRDIALNGDTFHVKVKTEWVTGSGTTASCEAGAAVGALAYKHVTVEVTWDNMSQGARPVYSDTALTPRTKINDPTLGTVLVGVVNAAGTAVSGATVSLSPAGVAAVTTDSDGCAYLLKVPAGTYTVKVSKTGYVNEQQQSTPTATVVVTAGDSSRASFAYDSATSYKTTFAPNLTGTVAVPNNLTTTFLSSYGNFQLAATTSAKQKTFALYPFASGYSVVAGAYAETTESPSTSCLSPDPGQWAEDAGKVGVRPDPVAGTSGGLVEPTVPMGGVTISNLKDNYLKAEYVTASPGAGDPGCKAGMTYTFDKVANNNATTFALPYGTWKLYKGTSASSQTTLITAGITVATTGSVSGGGVVLLDPRVAG